MWAVEFAEEALKDFGLIADHLSEAYQSFGDSPQEAMTKAAARLIAIRDDALSLAKAPHRGTLHPDMGAGLRSVTINRAVFWFDLDETDRKIRVLAVFLAGQDHIRHMLLRLLT